MNNERMLKEIGDIDPGFIREAEPKMKRRSALSWALPMAAAFVLIAGLALTLPKLLGNKPDGQEKSAALPTGLISAGADPTAEAPALTDAPDPGAGTKGTVPGSDSSGDISTAQPAVGGAEDNEALIARYLAAAGEDMAIDAKDRDRLSERLDAIEGVPDMKDFTSKLFEELLREDPDGNTVLSPVSVYAALSMAAETADGGTRAEILELLGAKSMKELRESTKRLITAESRDDDFVKCLFANSLWMNNAYGYDTDTLEKLSKEHGASVFWGDPEEEDYTLALRAWLNDKTGGLLEQYADETKLDPDTLLALVSTVYFRCSWDTKYDSSATAERVFHAKGGDIVCDFMTKQPQNLSVHIGENFTALGDRLNEGAGTAWFLLPDEGVSVEQMLAAGAMEFVLSDKPEEDRSTDCITSDIVLTVPKLDISSKYDLIPALEALGVRSCFDPAKADFTPLMGEKGPFIGKAEHAARICADEDGVEAAAYTLVQYYGGKHAPKSEYVLDRPFVMVISGCSGSPLFVGVVNTPNN